MNEPRFVRKPAKASELNQKRTPREYNEFKSLRSPIIENELGR